MILYNNNNNKKKMGIPIQPTQSRYVETIKIMYGELFSIVCVFSICAENLLYFFFFFLDLMVFIVAFCVIVYYIVVCD